MVEPFLQPRQASASQQRTVALAGQTLTLELTVQLTTPGDACVVISSHLGFTHTPALPDDIAVRLDDRLYDGIYDGLALVPGPLPPERLRVQVISLTSDPPLATLLVPPDWRLIGLVGDELATLASDTVQLAWPHLLPHS